MTSIASAPPRDRSRMMMSGRRSVSAVSTSRSRLNSCGEKPEDSSILLTNAQNCGSSSTTKA